MKTNDWINIERIMVFVRFNIEDESNIDILNIIESFVNGKITEKNFYHNIIDIREHWRTQLIICETDDKCINDSEECLFLVKYVQYAIESMVKRNFPKAYDIVDMLQAFPGVVLCGEDESKNNFEKIYLSPLIDKWNVR